MQVQAMAEVTTHFKHQIFKPRLTLGITLGKIPYRAEGDFFTNLGVVLGQFGKLAESDCVPFGSGGTTFCERIPVAASPRTGKAYAEAVFSEVTSYHGNL